MLELRCTIQLVFPFPSLACVFSRLINYLNCWFLIEFVHSFSSFCTLCNYEWCNYELRSALEKEAKIFFITYYSCTSPFWCTCPLFKIGPSFCGKERESERHRVSPCHRRRYPPALAFLHAHLGFFPQSKVIYNRKAQDLVMSSVSICTAQSCVLE